MPCNNCGSHIKAVANTVVLGQRLMIGQVLCKKEKRILTPIESNSDLAPAWCPKGIDKANTCKSEKQPVPQEPSRFRRKAEQVQSLVAVLNRHRDAYYNQNAPSISDAEYDRLFDKLRRLEREAGFVMSNSPTQTVGYKTVSNLEKTSHAIPLLSLHSTKLTDEILAFTGKHQILVMHKLDGLTIKLEYEHGELIRATTRGDGNEGDIVTHNASAISGIPQKVPYQKRLVVVGEAYIHISDFEILKDTLLDSTGKPYRNARNLAAGSVRCLDAAECVKRLISFTPFNVQEGLDEDPIFANSKFVKLNHLSEFGFSKCGYLLVTKPLTQELLEEAFGELQKTAERDGIPIDGLVCTFNDIAFSKSCGRTGHHYKDGIAFKFEDDLHETILRSVEWKPTRSGEISAVAIYDPVEIDGCEMSRASLHNLTFIKELELMPECRILVSKRNKIIPHIEGNLDRGRFSDSIFPKVCPCCGQLTRIQATKDKDREIETLHCDNPECETQRLRQFVHFVGKKAMNIEGLSEATLEQFIGRGWLVTFMDVYHLDRHQDEIVRMEGFGEKSYGRLWDAIQASRNTTFERYLISMDIPMIGRTASGRLCRQFGGSLDAFEAAVDSGYDFTQLPGFGITYHQNIHEWFQVEENRLLWKELQTEMNIQNTAGATDASAVPVASGESVFAGKTIVITGMLEHFSRASGNAKIASLGATAGDSVTSKTDYVVYGKKAGSKLEKARKLGITILSEQEFLGMAGEA